MRLKLLILLLLVVVLGGLYWNNNQNQIIALLINSPNRSQDVAIDRVQDSTHLRLKDGRTIALCGVVIPNSTMSQAAQSFLKDLVKRSEGAYLVEAAQSGPGSGKGEITLRLPGSPSSELNLTSDLILEGYGSVAQQDSCPNLERFQVAEERAKKQRIGIWKG